MSSRRRRSSCRRRPSTTGSGSSRSHRATSISEHRLTWLDVFAPRALAGNGLAVVHGADGLDAATMLAFARETRLSETTYVQSADAGADYVNRIFTTVGELPFAGHPSLGTAVAVARERGETQAQYTQRTPAGEQPVRVALDGRSAYASMLQEPARFGAGVDPEQVATVVGLSAADLDPALPPRFVSTGVFHLIAPLHDASALERVSCHDAAALAQLLAPGDAIVVYLAAPTAGAGDRWRARGFFVGENVVLEDPATGSAAGPLCADLAQRAGRRELTIGQGVEMGRPSVLDAAIEGDRVRVGGAVLILAEGVVHL